MKLVKTEDAVGHVLCHDMTQIIRGVTKDVRFRKGHIVTPEDSPVLLSMGKENPLWHSTWHGSFSCAWNKQRGFMGISVGREKGVRNQKRALSVKSYSAFSRSLSTAAIFTQQQNTSSACSSSSRGGSEGAMRITASSGSFL